MCATATRGIVRATVQVVNILKEVVQRILGSLDVVVSVSGIRPAKNLRLRIVILCDAAGQPVAAASDVYPALRAAQDIFATQAQIQLIPAGGPFVHTCAEAAPPAALAVHCGFAAWTDDLGVAGAYFASHLAHTLAGILSGYAAPLTVFIVQDMHAKRGCSLGPLVDYVTVARAGLHHARSADADRPQSHIVAHELGHACGLWHSRDATNLMHPSCGESRLRWWQTAIIRSSRHVTYV